MLYLRLGFINDLRGTVGALISCLHFVCLDVLVETAGGVQHLAALSTLQGLPSGHYYNICLIVDLTLVFASGQLIIK